MKEVHLGDPHEVKNKNNGKLRKTVGNLLKKKKVSMHLHKNFSFSQLSLISTPKVESKIEEETPSKEEE